MSASGDDAALDKFVNTLEGKGIKAVVFDFDQTITLKHSGGRQNVAKMPAFLQDNVSSCFSSLLPKLHSSNFQVGVATFADDYKVPATHVAGEDLVRAFFSHYFSDDFKEKIPVIAAYPENYQDKSSYTAIGLNSPMPKSKGYHLAMLCEKWGIERHEVMLVDDDRNNVLAATAEGYSAVFVKDRKGLELRDLHTAF